MKRKETIKKIIFTILIFILGIITSLLVIYKYPNIFKINTTKLEKSVTITDNGISDAVEKVYDKVIIVTTYNNNQKYSSGSGFIYDVDKESTYIITNNSRICLRTPIHFTFNIIIKYIHILTSVPKSICSIKFIFCK